MAPCSHSETWWWNEHDEKAIAAKQKAFKALKTGKGARALYDAAKRNARHAVDHAHQEADIAGLGGSVGCASNNPRQVWRHSFVEIDHEIFSMGILSLPLIQEGQLSVSGERMCTILVNHLED